MITMNEEGAVALVIKQIRAVAPGAEILIVDSSKDQTAEIAGALGARVGCDRTLTFDQKTGRLSGFELLSPRVG